MMNRGLRLAAATGIFAFTGVVACGDDGAGDDGASGAGAGGATPGGAVGTAGTLSGGVSSGGASAGRGGADVRGGSGGVEGPETAGEGGLPAAGGSPALPGEGGAGVDGGGSLGGAGGAGGVGDTSGSGGGGVSGEGGEPSGGMAGASGECGDGVLSAGEHCCTPEWVEARTDAVVREWASDADGNTECLAPRTVSGVPLCNTAVCPGGELGCEATVTLSPPAYTRATSTVAGTMNIVVTGHAGGSGVLGCNFVAYFNDLAYEAEVLKTITAESLRLGIGTPEIEPDPVFDWGGCTLGPILEPVLVPIVKQQIAPAIQAQLVETLESTEACPY